MRRRIDDLTQAIEVRERTNEVLRERNEALTMSQEIRARSDAAWLRAFAGRTDRTAPTKPPLRDRR